jgi:hypothetical protein
MKWTDCSLMFLDKSSHIYGPWKKSAPVFQIPPGTDLTVCPLTPIQYFWTISTYLEDFSIIHPGAIPVRCYMVIQLFYMFFMHYFSENFPRFTMSGTVNKVEYLLHKFTNEFTVTTNSGLFNTKSLTALYQNVTVF